MRFRYPMSALIGLLFAVACESPFITDAVGTTPATDGSVTLTVVANSPTLTVGQSTQITAMVKDAAGQPATSGPISWSTSAPAVASVSTEGSVTALSAGTATITATTNGKSAGTAVTVIAPSQTPPGGAASGIHIPLRIQRFDGGSGTVQVSNAIPLAPGLLMPAATKNVQLFVNGIEQPIYVEVLQGRHADGSLRSILVQFNASIPAGQVLNGELAIGSARTTTDLARPTTGRSTPAAVALPTDPNYLVSTDLVGPTLSADSTALAGGAFARYDADFSQWADYQWTYSGADWSSGNYYDRAAIYYAFWVRTGNPEYWRRGTLMAVNYRTGYLEPNNYGSSAHWSLLDGLERHYILTGDDSSRHAVAAVANVLNAGWYWNNLSANDTRIKARMLMSYLLAWRINADTMGSYYADVLRTGLPKMLATQSADGAYRDSVFCNQSSAYMTGMFNDALIQYYTYFSPDPRIPSAVKRSADWLSAHQWVDSAQAFTYISGDCPSDAAGPTLAGDLNNLIVNTFAWTYATTKDPTYKTMADKIFVGAQVNGFPSGTKQFNQEYTTSYRYLAYRR
jgi:hypothetical protein